MSEYWKLESYWNQQNGSGVDSDSALGLEELNPTPIPGGKWWSGVDSDSESRQNGVDSGFGVDSTGINYKSGNIPVRYRTVPQYSTLLYNVTVSCLKVYNTYLYRTARATQCD